MISFVMELSHLLNINFAVFHGIITIVVNNVTIDFVNLEFHRHFFRIDSNMFKLKVNIDPELLAEGLDELLNLLKPQIPKENNTEDNTKLADKMSKELNDHYHCQAILHIYS